MAAVKFPGYSSIPSVSGYTYTIKELSFTLLFPDHRLPLEKNGKIFPERHSKKPTFHHHRISLIPDGIFPEIKNEILFGAVR